MVAIAVEDIRRIYPLLGEEADSKALMSTQISDDNSGMQDEIAALETEVDALRAELATMQAQGNEQSKTLSELQDEREAYESAKQAALERVRPERDPFRSSARMDRRRSSSFRFGLPSSRRQWHRLTDSLLRTIAISAFVLAVCGILGTVIFSLSDVDTPSIREAPRK
ncbi:MAG: chromosome segregation ATPase [Gammaproteobacteria bacterium]|jgi:chromosome segregation ATPase